MTPLERLMAEGVPDGTFGASRPAQPRRKALQPPRWTAAEQAAHYAELAAALGEPHLRLADAA
ncbi:hypothetical protein CG740_23285 [Streptomyces sp. CB01201]|uniref:hypothetical protein n=1 Tax=Streptomyces sp. CB01201 TaxID=2020324 RepID=UPI000C279706|nr:hypothetical protein [Streptomyces sp. CB01201]PJN00831.1 hypothetical protein CG740_23285 [Streptomyces sp. CB01201]